MENVKELKFTFDLQDSGIEISKECRDFIEGYLQMPEQRKSL